MLRKQLKCYTFSGCVWSIVISNGDGIIIVIIISFMQGIYTYIPETNYVPREYSVAGILLLLFIVLISLVPVFKLLYFYISTFRIMCAVSNMAFFWSSLTLCFPGMLLTYFLNYFELSFVLSCLLCNCCWLTVCIVILCVCVVLCVYCCFYFRCRTAG